MDKKQGPFLSFQWWTGQLQSPVSRMAGPGRPLSTEGKSTPTEDSVGQCYTAAVCLAQRLTSHNALSLLTAGGTVDAGGGEVLCPKKPRGTMSFAKEGTVKVSAHCNWPRLAMQGTRQYLSGLNTLPQSPTSAEAPPI